MQSLKFIRTNGNIPKKLAGEDHISGLVIYSAALPSGFSESVRIKAVSLVETALIRSLSGTPEGGAAG